MDRSDNKLVAQGGFDSLSHSGLSHDDLLRFENALLLSEKRFLTQELHASSHVASRVTTARCNDTAAECEMLRSYLYALEAGDAATCRAVSGKLQLKVTEMRTKSTMLEKLLRGVRKEVRFVLDNTPGA